MTEAVVASAAEAVAIVDPNGRIRLPAEIRAFLDLTEGDEMILESDDGRPGRVTLRRRSAVEQTFGVVPSLGRPLTPQELHRIVEEEIVAEYVRETNSASSDRS